MEHTSDQQNEEQEEGLKEIIPVAGMYKNWFLDYASYVILERAVPTLLDGLKPVQRRILHAMYEMEDGRYNKVANIIGQTMQYHPHGDASIGEAIINLGQKDLLIDCQGNWGDIRTGDAAAAPRYIEARLSKFAEEVLFNPNTTEWQLSYDGRKREPVILPVKFPLLLAQGVEGIAVGLATKVLPHNFCELIEASIQLLKGKSPNLYPDFPTGGMADVSAYNEGQKGGRVRVRAKIVEQDKKTLLIKDIPFGTTTGSIIESIVKASENGKIKIKKVVDNTAREVEIQIQLIPGTSPDITIDALYAFTECEVSLSPNACVILDDKPQFLGVNEILRISTENTKELLRQELEIRKSELQEKLLFSSLEKLFILNEMYIPFKEYSDKPGLFAYLNRSFEPYKQQFYREIGDEDFEKLTQIPMIRITRFDSFKAEEKMRGLEEELRQTEHHLAHLTDFAIDYFKKLLVNYGKGRERKTELKTFDTIAAHIVAAANQKLYVNRQDGFIGSGLKKDEYVADCSDLDDVIAFLRNGKFKVVKISDKVFVGKDILHVSVFKKNDDRRVYNLAYVDGASGITYVKRFQVLGITRDKEYDLTLGTKASRLLYFTDNPNGEAEVITVNLSPGAKAKIKAFDFDFSTLAIKGRASQGNRLTKYPVRKIVFKSGGVSTLGGLDLWYDPVLGRLNTDGRGRAIGNFAPDDKVLVVYKNGEYELTSFELTNRYEPNEVFFIGRFNPEDVLTAIYLDGPTKTHFIKRFQIETSSLGKRFLFLPDSPGTKLDLCTTESNRQAEITVQKSKQDKEVQTIDLDMLIDVKGWKAQGNKLSTYKVLKIELLESPDQEDEVEAAPEPDGEPDDSTTPPAKEDQTETFSPGEKLSFKPKPVKPDPDSAEQLGLF